MVLPKPQNPPAILYNTIFDCERILRIVRRFFGLQSRLRIRNPLQSPRNPPNPLAIHYNQDCEHLSQSYTIQCNPTQSIKIIRGLCLWLQYLCRARQCYNPRGKSVSRQGLNHQGRCTIKTAKILCFHILQSGRNPIFILFNPCRLYQDCKISVDTPVLDDYMVLWLCGVPPLSGPLTQRSLKTTFICL